MMDDPWGSPWATDEAAADSSFPAGLPTINLPAAPAPATLSSRGNSPRVSPRVSVSGGSPWKEEDDAWGGWNDAKSGTSSPGWGRSPGLKPALVREERDVSPGPWMGRKSRDKAFDSAISLEKDKGAPAHEPEDLWQKQEEMRDGPPAVPIVQPEPSDEDSSVSEPDDPVRATSPHNEPPGPALSAEDRPEPVRQSSKVQELVDMFDGIAKGSVSPAESSIATPPLQRARDVGTGQIGGQDEQGDEAVASQTTAAPDKALDVDITARAPEPEVSPTANGWPEDEATGESGTLSPIPRVRINTDIQWPVDLSHLDDLFPSTVDHEVEPEPLPDTIIDDTFATISERKTWYRISRFGSKRKHDTGNDENYVRVDWAHSAVRDKSIRIVRRWMEEDSIAGRVTLGARQKGAIGGSMFNWDSKAEPVDVGALLGRGRGHERRMSKDSKGSKGMIAPPPEGPAFGWSSQTTSPTSTSFSAASRAQVNGAMGAKSRPQSLIMPPQSRVSRPIESPVQPKARPQSLVMPPAQAMFRPSIDSALASPSLAAAWDRSTTVSKPAEEDEDDWGEMVSSPTVAAVDTFGSVDSQPPRTMKAVGEDVTPPSAANLALKGSPIMAESSLKQPKASGEDQTLPSATTFAWDDIERRSSDAPVAPTTTETNPDEEAFGWAEFEKPASKTPEPIPNPNTQPSAAAFGWEDFEKPLQPTQKASSPVKSPTSPMAFGWAAFEEPKKGTPTVNAETAPLSNLAQVPAVEPVEPVADATMMAPKLSSPTTASPLSQTSQPEAASVVTATPSPPITSHAQPQSSKGHANPSLDSTEDGATVARILHELPDLSYMLR